MMSGLFWIAALLCYNPCQGLSLEQVMSDAKGDAVEASLVGEVVSSRQLGEVTDTDCMFNLQDTGLVDSCNWTVDVTQYKVYPWDFNVGINSFWLGGPPVDGDGTVSGGFAFMDMSAFFDRPKDGYQKRGWLLTDMQVPTTVRGRCLVFKYSIQGLNVEALRLIRVDIMAVMPDLQVAEISQEKHKTNWEFINTSDDVAAAVNTVMDKAFGDGSAKLEVCCLWGFGNQTLV